MPEIPDVAIYVERLNALFGGQRLERIRLKSPFLLRSYEPPLSEFEGKILLTCRRFGKRIVFEFEGDLYWVLHLMIAGRLHLRQSGAPLTGKAALLALDFARGSLVLTEAGHKRRASLHAVRGAEALGPFDRGGVEPLTATLDEFHAALIRENRTIKRALTDPRLVSGIGNAYSDEILHAARLSPALRTQDLTGDAVLRLHQATRVVLERFTQTLRSEVGEGFPEKVTAFRADMAVHGRYGKPCPVCSTSVQRVAFADNEMNYCPRCQTGGKLLADRRFSKLLKGDWPKTVDELEALAPDGSIGTKPAKA